MRKAIWNYGILPISILAGVWHFAGDCFKTTQWVGRTNLTIRVLAIDQSTGSLIPNATIEIRSEDDAFLPAPGQRSPIDNLYHAVLPGNPSGATTIYKRETMRSGTIRPITFTDTHVVMLPGWIINVAAADYQRSEDCFIQARTHSKLVARTSGGESELELPILLNRVD